MNKRILTYFSFVLACLVVITIFVTATTYTQLAVAIWVYLMLACIAFVIYRHKGVPNLSRKESSTTTSLQGVSSQAGDAVQEEDRAKFENIGISDFDKRVFLKLIGGTGIFLFFFSLLNKKTESIFFKNVPGQTKLSLEDISGNKIDPAQNQPMDGYRITEVDDNIISFYGFTNKDGHWYIMKIDTNTGSFRYIKSESNFPGNWANRGTLKYDYFSNVF